MLVMRHISKQTLLSHLCSLYTAAMMSPTAKVLNLPQQTPNGCLLQQNCVQQDQIEILKSTVNALKDGEVVAVPTDTLYGLACLAQSSEAVKKVYDIKGRNGQKPLAICVGEIEEIYKYCKVAVKRELLENLLPGPVTLVLERSADLNPDLNPFTPLVGVRIPDHPFMRRLCQMCGEPLALTSANISSKTSTVDIHEFQELWPRVAVVVNGGRIGDQSRQGSTVVNLSVPGRYSIIRPGCALAPTLNVLECKFGLLEDTESQKV
ncbi:hypothetical protein ACEWY4_020461 [Coilia grayii]|uniref:Threonylcarbamoyl-AMP synthase n=1 Tax=Coilia grayii TaxID=363190 RepID=A0ABD1JCR1_9TELE